MTTAYSNDDILHGDDNNIGALPSSVQTEIPSVSLSTDHIFTVSASDNCISPFDDVSFPEDEKKDEYDNDVVVPDSMDGETNINASSAISTITTTAIGSTLASTKISEQDENVPTHERTIDENEENDEFKHGNNQYKHTTDEAHENDNPKSYKKSYHYDFDHGKDDDVHIPAMIHQDDGNCLPSVEEIHQSEHHHHRHSTWKKPIHFAYHVSRETIIRCICVAAIVLCFILIITLVYHHSPSSSSSLYDGDGSNTTTKPVFTYQYNQTMEYLVQNNISTYESLTTYGTPQYYATVYLADTLQLSIPQSSSLSFSSISQQQEEIDQYITRYVLALDYYHFTNYNQTYRDDDDDDSEHPPFMNFITSGPDFCQWNFRSRISTMSNANNDTGSQQIDTSIYDKNRTIQMGVTCDAWTKLPINITISSMNIRGTLPTENGLLRSLQIFNMENNDLNGFIPTEICQLTKLQTLNLGRNNFYSRIPSCIGDSLTNLQSLYLHGNNLNDPLPTSIMKLQQLKHFIISDNLLSGDPIPIWNQLTSLEVLLADRNDFLSSVDVTFLWNSTLRWIDLSDNNLELAHNHPFPRHLLQMSTLEVLDFSRNRLEGPLHDGLQSNTALQYLSLYGNWMDGGIHELTSLRNIRHLDVSENQFSGTIPSEFGALSHLRLLFLGDNEYSTGQIPSSFVNLTQLEDLSIRDSQLNGTFDLSYLPKSLIYLDLGSNTLTGGIPVDIGNYSNLEFLILNNNPGIAGSLPTTITQLSSLRATFLDGTSLTSGVDQICTLPKFRSSGSASYDVVAYADCGKIDGNNDNNTKAEVDCECCRCCTDIGDNGMGCSISYQINLRQDWSEDFQKLKFAISNDTVFIHRDIIPKVR